MLPSFGLAAGIVTALTPSSLAFPTEAEAYTVYRADLVNSADLKHTGPLLAGRAEADLPDRCTAPTFEPLAQNAAALEDCYAIRDYLAQTSLAMVWELADMRKHAAADDGLFEAVIRYNSCALAARVSFPRILVGAHDLWEIVDGAVGGGEFAKDGAVSARGRMQCSNAAGGMQASVEWVLSRFEGEANNQVQWKAGGV